MNNIAEQILEEAMRLDPQTRALVAEALLETLDVGPDFKVSEAWRSGFSTVWTRCLNALH